MGKPSIFSSDYKKIMRRRKAVFRIAIVVIAAAVLFLAYNKSAVTYLKKIAQEIKWPLSSTDQVKEQQPPQGNTAPENKPDDNAGSTQDKPQVPEQKQVEEQGVRLENGDEVLIVSEKSGENTKITGVNAGSRQLSISIRDDGQAVVFDNPDTSDIWIYSLDGTLKKLNPDKYKQIGEEGLVFYKNDVMNRYKNNYIWASKPVFLKDGRILYQSNLPWFKSRNNIYLWVVSKDGTGNRMLVDTGQMEPVKYQGFTDDGSLIIEMGGKKYSLNTADGSKQLIH